MKNKFSLLSLLLLVSLLVGCGNADTVTNDNKNVNPIDSSIIEDIIDEANISDELESSESNTKVIEDIKEEKIIEKTTIKLPDETELEVTNEFEYTAKQLSDNILTEPFLFTKYEYQIYPNTPLKYIKDIRYTENKDGTYTISSIGDVCFNVINTNTGDNTIDEKYSDYIYITGLSYNNYPNVLSGVDSDFLDGIKEYVGDPTYVVASYPDENLSTIYYIWVNVDDTLLLYHLNYSSKDDTYYYRDTYVTTIRGLDSSIREAIGLEINESKYEYVVMRQCPEFLSKYVDVIDVYETVSIVKEEYMSDEALNILIENYFSDLPATNSSFKEYAPNNTAKGTYEPGEKNYAEPNGNYNKLYFSNKTNEKCTPNNLTVDSAVKTLSNPGIGTPDLLISDMLEIYGQPNAIRDYYFVYITDEYYIVFERESSDTTLTNRNDYFDSIVEITLFYKNSTSLSDAALDRIAYFESLNN